MDVKIIVTLICFALASVLHESAAVKCYQCTSMFGTDKKCEDDFNKADVPTIDCNFGCGKLKAEKDDLQYVQRMCAVQTGSDDCVSQSAGGADGNYCTCNSDYCNSARSMLTTVPMIGVFVTGFTLLRIVL